MRPLGIVHHVGSGDQPAAIAIGRKAVVDVYNLSVLMKPQQFPRSTVMLAGPAAIQNVREAEKPVCRRGRGERLPILILVAWSTEHHHAVDALVLCKASRSCRSVGAAGDDHPLPAQALTVIGQELLPFPLRMFLRQPTDELIRPFHHAVGLGNVQLVADVFTNCRFQTDVAASFGIFRRRLAQFAKPLVGITDLDRMNSVSIDALEQGVAMAHQPNHQFALWRHPRIDGGILNILWLAIFDKHEVDFGVLLGARIDHARPRLQFVSLWLGIAEGVVRRLRLWPIDRGFCGLSKDDARSRKPHGHPNRDPCPQPQANLGERASQRRNNRLKRGGCEHGAVGQKEDNTAEYGTDQQALAICDRRDGIPQVASTDHR